MALSHFIRCILVCLCLCTPLFAQETAEKPGKKDEQTQIKFFTGEVIGAYNNDVFIMQEKSRYYIVYVGKEFWDLGLSRGDKVKVKGTMRTDTEFNNELKALEIEKISSNMNSRQFPLSSLGDALGHSSKKGLMFTYGTISKHIGDHESVLEDSGHKVILNFSNISETKPLPLNSEIVVFGEYQKSLKGPVIMVGFAKPLYFFAIPGAPQTVQDIPTLLKNKPIGDKVKVKGRISVFIGKQKAAVIYDGENVLIIHRSDKYLSFNLKAGVPVEVIGTFSVETHDGKEYGALKDAQVIAPKLLHARDLLKKSKLID
jgi:RNase P/RNase MRP subunit p29